MSGARIPGEELVTLDGTLRSLEPSDLLITDAVRPVALAGIMGGLESEVGETTTDILLEAANFEPIGILETLRAPRATDRGLEPMGERRRPIPRRAGGRVRDQLIVELGGARWTGHTDVHAGLPPRPVTRLRPERTDALIGLEIPPAEQREILVRLGFDVAADWTVTVPTWRARDVSREVDLIEEVARIHGLEKVPFTLPERRAMFGRLTQEQRLRRRSRT